MNSSSLSKSWVVSTLAGNGEDGYADDVGTAAQFAAPFGVAVDSNDNIYVADYSNHRIRIISSAGVVRTFAGGTAVFDSPHDVTVDSSGNVYLVDADNHRIRKITPAGMVSTFAGSGTQGYHNATGTEAQFYSPEGVAADSDGNVYVADSSNNRIQKITPTGTVSTLAGSGIRGSANNGYGYRWQRSSGAVLHTHRRGRGFIRQCLCGG